VVAQPVALTRHSPPAAPARSPHAKAARRHPAGPGHALTRSRGAVSAHTSTRSEPGGFAYLGVPTTTSSTPPPAADTARTGTHNGGPFSP
jgi:hypothetical protein